MALPLTSWPSITKLAQFTRVDAVVPVPPPAAENPGFEFYFFSGAHYTRNRLGAAPALYDKTDQGRMDNTSWNTIQQFQPYPIRDIDSAMTSPGFPDQIDFFRGHDAIRCEFVQQANGDWIDRQVAHDFGPLWGVLPGVGIPRIDAIMPLVGNLYFIFCGGNFAVVDFGVDPPVAEGPFPIFEALVDAGFPTVDACMRVPGTEFEYYIFRGGVYIRFTLDGLPPARDDKGRHTGAAAVKVGKLKVRVAKA